MEYLDGSNVDRLKCQL